MYRDENAMPERIFAQVWLSRNIGSKEPVAFDRLLQSTAACGMAAAISFG